MKANAIIEPYLFFNGCCEEALEFYESAIDAKRVMLMRFNESPEPPPPSMVPPGHENKVMHASIWVGKTMVMASDGCGENQTFGGFSLYLNVASEELANRYFEALSEGGTVNMPLGKTFWSPRFGMLTDKFGVGWMVGVIAAEQQGCLE